jgi:threonine dehydratase
VIGVEPELAADARASLKAGEIVQFSAEQVARTSADGLRTQSIGPINFEHLQAYLDDIVTVSEQDIERATRELATSASTIAEPSGAVSVAAFLFHQAELPDTEVNVAVISGGNIDPARLAEMRKEIES